MANGQGDHVRSSPARNPATPQETLATLAKDQLASVRDYVSQNKSTPIESLTDLSRDPKEYIADQSMRTLGTIASDRSTAPYKLTRLSELKDPMYEPLMEKLAGNPSAPPAVLDALATREYQSAPNAENAKRAVAENQATSLKTLIGLAGDQSGPVTSAALKHIDEIATQPTATADLIDRLAATESPGVREIAARSALASPKLQARLATDKSQDVRTAVAANSTTSPEILSTLPPIGLPVFSDFRACQ